MTLAEALYGATRNLALLGFREPRLESEMLLMHLLSIGRVELYLRLEEPIAQEHVEKLRGLVKRRARYEPMAYIMGRKEFFGLDLQVDPHVLIPRPESELLVERALAFVRGLDEAEGCIIADIGTGCGAIAIALAVHLPQAKVYATDISPAALEVAAGNARRHGVGVRVVLLQGDMLEPLPEPVHLVVANLPYVKQKDLPRLSPEIHLFEPRLALDGGREGLDKIERLLSQAGPRLLPGGVLLFEIGYDQGQAASDLARRYFTEAGVEVLTDLGGRSRAVYIETKKKEALSCSR